MKKMNNNVKNGYNKSTLKEQQNEFKDMLSTIFNIIEKFEQNEKIDSKIHKEKMDILKNFIAYFIKNEEQKKIIMGEKIMKERPAGSKYKVALI